MHPIVIPEDETFMMGDNRDHSNDSRFWGSVPINILLGRLGLSTFLGIVTIK